MKRAVVILAGGEGQRIGGDKPRRRLGGRSLLARAVEFAHTQAPDVAVSLRRADQAPALGAETILDAAELEGPLAGLAAALRFARERGFAEVLTLPCDAPFLPDDLLQRLAAAFVRGERAAIPSSAGQLHPTCALWRGEALDELPAYAATGRRSLNGFAASIGAVEVRWDVEGLDPFFNVNSAEDLARAEAILAMGKEARPPLPRG